jgi:Asp-tRNA(Asn)/Glu-tRNA(Gln) amidotransferase A subunit family amidase
MHSRSRKGDRVDDGNDRATLAPLAEAVRSGAVTAKTLVEESMRRIDAARDLGAVIRVVDPQGRLDAERLDGRVGAGEDPGRLAGLPVLVKDSEAVAGVPTTFGSATRAAAQSEASDGLVASVLRGAGAIIVGKTNLPEFAFEGYTCNLLFGPTRNPWDRRYSPGGSSGGSGAALAAGLAPIATATDVGGSIRIPAALCGLVGLKPTAGLIAVDPSSVAPRLNGHGPIAATAADAKLLLDVLIAGAPGPGAEYPHHLRGTRRPARVLVTERLFPGPPLPDVIGHAFRSAQRALTSVVGGTVEHVASTAVFPGGFEPEDWFRIVGFEQARALGSEVLAEGASELDPAFARSMRQASALRPEEHDAALGRCSRYTREIDRLLDDDAILVSPTLTVDGWSPDGRLPGQTDVLLPSWVYNTEPANLTGHPALSLPGGLLPDGRPFGIQIIGPRFADWMLLELAAAYERVAPWPLAAPGYRPFTIDTLCASPFGGPGNAGATQSVTT